MRQDSIGAYLTILAYCLILVNIPYANIIWASNIGSENLNANDKQFIAEIETWSDKITQEHLNLTNQDQLQPKNLSNPPFNNSNNKCLANNKPDAYSNELVGNFRQASNQNNASTQNGLKIMMSFAVPINVWQSLGAEMQKIGGQFVLAGIPDNDFKILYQKLLELRKAGINNPISIDPKLFSSLHIKAVPAFYITENEKYDLIIGNVSLLYALNKVNSKGETKTAKDLYAKLKMSLGGKNE